MSKRIGTADAGGPHERDSAPSAEPAPSPPPNSITPSTGRKRKMVDPSLDLARRVVEDAGLVNSILQALQGIGSGTDAPRDFCTQLSEIVGRVTTVMPLSGINLFEVVAIFQLDLPMNYEIGPHASKYEWDVTMGPFPERIHVDIEELEQLLPEYGNTIARQYEAGCRIGIDIVLIYVLVCGF